ncbi:hypothetical protein CIW51_05390 [Mycolicibacterium sp. P9-22]|nr:hypothetical protein CIW51_05390 [Mycolicibacterium sp. P9-22]
MRAARAGSATGASGTTTGAGAVGTGCGTGVAVALGVTVVTVSGGSDGTAGAGAVALGATVAEGCAVGSASADVVTPAETVPLSPPPRITPVQITATIRITPATPATQIQRRSSGSW